MNLVNENNRVGSFWKEIAFISLIFGTLFFTVSAFLPLEYKANASILIVQKDAQGLDAYREVKSAEFTGKIMKELLLSNSFMEGVLSTNNKARLIIEKEKGSEDKLAKWRDSFSINQVSNTGVLNLSFFAGNKDEARSVLTSIIKNLSEKGLEYHGNPQIGIKVVNTPYALDDPSFPNLWLNTILGIIFGVFLSLVIYQINPVILRSVLGRSVKKQVDINRVVHLDLENLK